MASLKEIQDEIKTAFSALEEATDENREELESALSDYLQDLGELEADKADAIGFMLREQTARIAFLKDEEKRIAMRRKSAENALSRTKDYFKAVMTEAGLQKVKGNTSTIYLRKSESVFVGVEAENLPEEFKKISISARAADIKKAIKSGVDVPGCEIRTNYGFNVR